MRSRLKAGSYSTQLKQGLWPLEGELPCHITLYKFLQPTTKSSHPTYAHYATTTPTTTPTNTYMYPTPMLRYAPPLPTPDHDPDTFSVTLSTLMDDSSNIYDRGLAGWAVGRILMLNSKDDKFYLKKQLLVQGE